MTQEKPALFTDLGLAEPLLKAVQETGYTTPTPIQAKAIPLAMQGLDLMAGAQTGTGKTAAFSLPILQRLLPLASTSTSPAKHPVRALILAPTRELAIQVADNIKLYAKHTALRSHVVFGGVDIKTQLSALKQGVEILVATPGRLLDHVEQKSVQLNQVQILVLDEADRMLDMGFMPDLKRILALLPKQRQTLMFSATFSNEIKKLADDFLKNPTLIEVARSNATNDNVEQILYAVDSHEKQMLLVQLLQEDSTKQVIVFTKTKLSASRLSRALQKQDINADAIHGDKSQKERLEALEAFKAGKTQALVATDVAARGLDISELPMVINYEIPTSPEDYVHRIGRTGRAGAKGIAISLMSPEEEKYWVEIEKLIKISVSKQVKTPALESKRGTAPKASSTKAASHRKAPKHDPWFDRPYEPMANNTPSKPAINAYAKKKPVAALLGGLAFKRNQEPKR